MYGKFPKKLRLKTTKEFQHVYKTGHRKENSYLIIYYVKNNLPYSRFGIVASRRLGGAVKRNRIKRILREVVRLREDLKSMGIDMVIIARKGMLKVGFKEASEAFNNLTKGLS